MALPLLFALAGSAHADADVPYYPREFKTNQEAGGVNENFQDLRGRNRNNLVPLVKDNSCAVGETLTGATQKGGYIFGGTCTSVSNSNTPQVFNSSVTFNGGVFGTLFGFSSARVTSGDQAITATASPGESVSGSTITLNCRDICHVQACVGFTASITGTYTSFDFLVDGVLLDGAATPIQSNGQNAGNNGYYLCLFSQSTYAIGAHSVTAQAWTNAGTATLRKSSSIPFYITAEEKRGQ